jgi:septal ring factor EnvC (AmiA/AmiB activator)
MLPPQTQSGKAVLEQLTSLSKELKFYSEGFKASRKLKSTLAEIDQIKKGISTATQSTKQLEKQFKAAQKVTDILNKDVKQTKKLWDALLKNVGGGVSGAAKIGKALPSLIGIAGAIAAVGLSIAVNEIQGWRNDEGERGLAQLSKDVSKVLGILNQQKQQIQKTNTSIEKTNRDVDSISKQLSPLKQRVEKTEVSIAKANKIINDNTYEIREGRKKTDEKIASLVKLIPNIDAIQKQVNDIVNRVRSDFQKQVDKISSDLKAQAQQQSKVQPASKQEVDKLTTDVKELVTTIKNQAESVKKTFDSSQNTIKQVVDRAIAPIARVSERWGVTVTPATIAPATITPSQGGGVTVREATVTPATVTPARFSASPIGGELRVTIRDEVGKIERQISVLGESVTIVGGVAKQAIDVANVALKEGQKRVLDPRVEQLATRIGQQEQTINAQKQQLTEQDRKIKEQERVNQEGNRKLDGLLNLIPQLNGKIDSIIPAIAGIPLIPGRVIDGIKPSIPTLPQIENATGTAMCKNLRTGCGKQAIDDAVGNINQSSNSNKNDLLDKLNAGLNAADLAQNTALLNTINNKLGDQVDGGISGKLGRISKWLQLDKVLNLLTFAATVHNAFQLSNDIGVTLGSAVSNILQLIGIKDDDGSPIDVGKIINSSVENLIKGTVGTENYQQMSEAFAKANRIYQATTNVLNSFLNLSQTILQASELIAAYTGRIGNALKKGGIILGNAYGWMNPQPKFNRVTNFLEGLQNGASTIQMVTQAPLDVINATTEFTTASTDFVKAIKEDNKPENKPEETPEPDELKAKEIQGKVNSQPLDFDFSDLFDGED